MKVIIDKNNPLTVVDQEGNVLFDWQPTTVKDLENMTLDELDAYFKGIINEARRD
ncbi:hypothetical protein [Bacillus sp. T33-2]|uniref:hypothetical protein n=1 Tax=Bacillus sp. T33-2 TaxID=2054168 RepID=UPI0015E0E41B|nr:hypothetical protein [Bacillus sp. T33-2]